MKKTTRSALIYISYAIALIAIGCILPLLIIHYKKPYQHWQPVSLEVVGLGGLSLLFGKLLLKK